MKTKYTTLRLISTLLTLFIVTKHAISQNNLITFSENISIWQYQDSTQEYEVIWTSPPIEIYNDSGWEVEIAYGDCDNDSLMEIMTTGKAITVYDMNDFQSTKSFGSRELYRTPQIGDLDGDGLNEIAVLAYFERILEIWKYQNDNYEKIWQTNIGGLAFSITIGDCDNDGKNEILVGSGDKINVYRFDAPSNTFLYWMNIQLNGLIDVVKVGDVNNDKFNEVVAGGGSRMVMIRKYRAGTGFYQIADLSPGGGFTQGIGIGDVDGDGMNEIIVGTTENWIFIYKNILYSNNYQVMDKWNITYGVDIPGIEVGDSDKDGIDEFVVDGNGIIQLWDFTNSTFKMMLTVEPCRYALFESKSFPIEEEEEIILPKKMDLSQGYPNPARAEINFKLESKATWNNVNVTIYDCLGRIVKIFIDGYLKSGFYDIQWDCTNSANVPVANGVYFIRLQSGDISITRKIVYLR